MEEKRAEDVQVTVTAKEVIGKPTMGVKESTLLVPELCLFNLLFFFVFIIILVYF